MLFVLLISPALKVDARNVKVKCDEVRPACSQCLKRRFECPGYEKRIRWSAKHEVSKPSQLLGLDPSGPREASKPDVPVDLPGLGGEPSSPTVAARHFQAQVPSSASTSAFANQHVQDLSADSPAGTFSEDLREWLLNQDLALSGDGSDARNFMDQSANAFPTGTNRMSVTPRVACPQNSDLDALSASDNDIQGRSQLGTKYGELLKYFFANICILHSTCEESANSFKNMIECFLDTSTLVLRCVVCISAIHCFQGDTAMLPATLEYQSAAIHSLSLAISQIVAGTECSNTLDFETPANLPLILYQLREALLASLLLGLTSPWFDPSNIGLPHLIGARAMAYWECCMAFVIDQPLNAMDYLVPFSHHSDKVYPHSFTGLSTPIFIALGRIGICVRQKQMFIRLDKFGWTDRDGYASLESELFETAAFLKQSMLQFTLPEDASIQGHLPHSIAIDQMRSFAEMYRFAALLELYRNFAPCSSCIEVERRIRNMSLLITGFAKELPEQGSWGIYQTLALIISGSVLYSAPGTQKPTVDKSTGRLESLDKALMLATTRPQQTIKCRDFVRKRLQVSFSTFRLDRISEKALALLEEVWRGFDTNYQQGIGGNWNQSLTPIWPHWTEIMAEGKLQTLLG
ncbi:hypothetical protein FANTH_4421 [Fusarium anthophilum]|uniref:Zn(2)-C6 fungal-type domain-containing protein n=1 Tax=Fusarium anthophilum TaxID=48485 RepID=A0A8H4ZPS8_9HYPO|nr:hypothetical protein FANTH_4421 [Fusarium anthophilum]